MRYFLAAVALVILALPALTHAADRAGVSSTYISGGRLPHSIRFAAADEDAFLRRLDAPPRLDDEPNPGGPVYTIRSPYWAKTMPGVPGTRDPAGESASYYPQGGYVSAERSDGTTTWLVLNSRQQAIIARYIRLGEKDLISPFPGILQVLKADALAAESMGIQLGSRELTEAEAMAFWQKLPLDSRAIVGVDSASPAPVRDRVERPHELPAGEAWLLITLSEGRAVQLLYRPDLGLLYDLIAQELYQAPVSVFAPILAGESSTAAAPIPVPQDEGSGSPLWWLVAGATSVACIAGALWLRRGAGGLSREP